MTATTAPHLLTANDLSKRWQVKTAHIYRLCREGKLPYVALGRYRRFSLAVVEQFEATGGTEGEG